MPESLIGMTRITDRHEPELLIGMARIMQAEFRLACFRVPNGTRHGYFGHLLALMSFGRH